MLCVPKWYTLFSVNMSLRYLSLTTDKPPYICINCMSFFIFICFYLVIHSIKCKQFFFSVVSMATFCNGISHSSDTSGHETFGMNLSFCYTVCFCLQTMILFYD